MEIFKIGGLVLGSLLVIWVAVTGWFFAVSHAQQLIRKGTKFDAIVNIPLHIYGYAGIIWDVLFNWTWGTIIFREIPQEWLFTDRVQRLITDNGWRRDVAWNWARRLNKVDPGHVDLPGHADHPGGP